MANANGIGELYAQMKNGVRGILSAQPYTNRIWYRIRRDHGGMRTVLIVDAEPHSENGGLGFRVHSTRLKDLLGIDFEELRTWLPQNSREEDLSGWAGSSEEEEKKRAWSGGLLPKDRGSGQVCRCTQEGDSSTTHYLTHGSSRPR